MASWKQTHRHSVVLPCFAKAIVVKRLAMGILWLHIVYHCLHWSCRFRCILIQHLKGSKCTLEAVNLSCVLQGPHDCRGSFFEAIALEDLPQFHHVSQSVLHWWRYTFIFAQNLLHKYVQRMVNANFLTIHYSNLLPVSSFALKGRSWREWMSQGWLKHQVISGVVHGAKLPLILALCASSGWGFWALFAVWKALSQAKCLSPSLLAIKTVMHRPQLCSLSWSLDRWWVTTATSVISFWDLCSQAQLQGFLANGPNGKTNRARWLRAPGAGKMLLGVFPWS